MKPNKRTQPKSRLCKSCKEPFKPFSSLQKVCGVACSIKLVREDNLKAIKKDTRERKRKLKTKSQYAKDAQIIFNQYIRERDNRHSRKTQDIINRLERIQSLDSMSLTATSNANIAILTGQAIRCFIVLALRKELELSLLSGLRENTKRRS